MNSIVKSILSVIIIVSLAACGRTSPEKHLKKGLIYLGRGSAKIDLAITEFQAALKKDPNFARAHYELGRAYVLKGSIDKAKQDRGFPNATVAENYYFKCVIRLLLFWPSSSVMIMTVKK